MALALAIKQSFVTGDRLKVVIDITGDTSYPTGGSALDFSVAPFSFSEIDVVEPQLPISGVRAYQYDYTNKKLKGFSAFNTEITNTTNCSADVIRAVVTGKGFAPSGV